MDNIDLREMSGLTLAYIGDSVWELEVRQFWLSHGLKINKLNKKVKEYVNAKSQSKYYKEIISSMEQKFIDIARRARNSNIKTFPRSCTVMEYREATAFEALIGALYLDKKEELIRTILNKCLKGVNEDGKI